MIDRDKVIKALECCVFPVSKGFPYQSHIAEKGCEVIGCPYQDDCDQLLLDTLELLKAQEPLKPVLKKIRLGFHTDAVHIEPCCGGCGHKLEAWHKYCSYCGMAVKLE